MSQLIYIDGGLPSKTYTGRIPSERIVDVPVKCPTDHLARWNG